MSRWYIIKYRHPGTQWIDYGEPVSSTGFDSVMRLIQQFPPFTEVSVKILDVKEPE
jgi:hypothetical protein